MAGSMQGPALSVAELTDLSCGHLKGERGAALIGVGNVGNMVTLFNI